ncbi:MAG TPA: hypothetical protein VJ802_12435 [Gemmatimonadaceae bacterium]|nr:hypothetical protein [Gemmatimonadaceae bacterium]
MPRLFAVALLLFALVGCDTPVAPGSPGTTGVALARAGDPPPPPEDADVFGFFGATALLRTTDLALIEEPPAGTGALEFSLDGRYFIGGGGVNGWLRLATSTDNVLTLNDPRIVFREDGAVGSGTIKVIFDQGSLQIVLAEDIAGATFSRTCAAGGAPCAVIDIAGADFLGLDGVFTEVDGTLVVVAEVDGG